MTKLHAFSIPCCFILMSMFATQAHAGSISGTVSRGSGVGLDGVTVEVYSNRSGTLVRSTQTRRDGIYSVTELIDGTYTVRTRNELGYVDEMYDNHPCGDVVCSGSPDAVTVFANGTATGIDFTLREAVSISGTVTSYNGPVPAGGHVLVYNSSGNLVKTSTAIGVAGDYEVTGLPVGDYFARTETFPTYEDELFDNSWGVSCPNGYCNITSSGYPISVAYGATTTGIDFDLGACHVVHGTVTSAGGPLKGVEVRLYSEGNYYNNVGQLVDTVLTDVNGEYVLGGSNLSDLTVLTSNTAGYVDEIWNDVQWCAVRTCSGSYDTFDLSGFDGADIQADFELVMGGTISGTVTDAATGNPLEGVNVSVYKSFAYAGTLPFKSAITDVTGAYTIRGLAADEYYFVATSNTGGWVDEIFDDEKCIPDLYCNVGGGTTVAVTLGIDTPDIDFALERGGMISGRVTDAHTGAPLADVYIEIDNSGGIPTGGLHPTLEVTSDADGNYITPPLPPGTYTARTLLQKSNGYPDEIWDDILCDWTDCDLNTGDPITVEADAVTTGIDFALTYGAIEGTITDAVTGAPIPNVLVRAYAASGDWGSQDSSDEQGRYAVIGLPVGTYTVAALSTDSHFGEAYDDLICFPIACGVVALSPDAKRVDVADGVATNGIDFALTPAGTISGASVHATTGEVVAADFYAYDLSGKQIAKDRSFDGQYSLGPLLPGTYVVKAEPFISLDAWVYDDQRCVPDCDAVTATPVTVSAGAETSGIDFVFDLGGRIKGRVFRADGWPEIFPRDDLIYISIHNQSGELVGGATPSFSSNLAETGKWASNDLPAGTYYARAHDKWNGGHETFKSQAYSLFPCEPDCDVTLATPITVEWGLDTEGINFHLEEEIGIAARIWMDLNPAVHYFAFLYDAGGNQVASCEIRTLVSEPPGCLFRGGLAAGTYYARTELSGYVDELYDGIPCPDGSCDVTTGTPIIFDPDNLSEHLQILFTPDREYSINGTVTGLEGGGLVLQNNGGNDLAVAENGWFTFPPVADGGAYEVTVLAQPANPTQVCEVANGSGTVSGAHVYDVSVSCATYCNVNTVSGGIEYAQKTHEACEILVLGPDFIVADGADVTAGSGWEIDFLPGFLVEQGGTFTARACGQSLCLVSPDPMPYGCHSCINQICDIDPSCCEIEFDQECLDRVGSECGLLCE